MGEAKRRHNRRDFSHCAYCGQPATSRDHVPPKCIFPSGRENLITVPACSLHNMHRSKLDELLLQFLGLHAEQVQPYNARLWDDALKSLKRSKRDRLIKERLVFDARTGLSATLVEAKPFIASVKTIVQGLYWHHQDEQLGLDTPISASMWRPDAELTLLSYMKSFSVAQGQFAYAFGVVDGDPKASVWYMQFQRNVLVCAYTGSAADAQDHS